MQDGDDIKHPNSVRFWRDNEITALRLTLWPPSLALDPEHHAAIIADRQRLAELLAREEAVRQRHRRLLLRHDRT